MSSNGDCLNPNKQRRIFRLCFWSIIVGQGLAPAGGKTGGSEPPPYNG